MNAPHPIIRRWDHKSSVTECETCEGRGSYVKTPQRVSAYRLNPLEWTVDCEDCEGLGIHPCEVCGFDEVVQGFDCLVCSFVAELTPANMKRINPSDLAEAFSRAFVAALDERRAA